MNYENQQKLVIEGNLPDLNKFIKACNGSRFTGNTLKQSADQAVYAYCIKQKLRPIKSPAFVEFHWYCKNKKIDKDNIAFAKKFILDGLQKAKVLLQDNWAAVDGFSDHFYIDGMNPRIEIIIRY